MRISKIQQNLHFQAGRTQVYSDFDGTYFPFDQKILLESESHKEFKDYCKKLQDFLNNTKDAINFYITTGRNLSEFESAYQIIKNKGFNLPLPQKLIIRNGSDEYFKSGSDADFYTKNDFPFKYKNRNLTKEKLFIKNNNWDNLKIRDFIKNSPILKSGLELRDDGFLKVSLQFPLGFEFNDESMKIYNNFFQELEKKLNEAQIKFSTEWEKAMKHNGYRRAYTISPTFDNDVLTKQYDVEIALKDAINNQDLIIVAGDGSNDFTMLNPLKYINKDFYNKCYQESTKKDFYQSSMEDKLKVLEKIFKNKLDSPYLKSLAEEFNKNGFIEKIKELPLYSVIIGQKNNWLNFLVETFEQTGKVITVESGNLEDGILRAIKDYSSKNEIFKQNLSKNFIKYLK